ncbi:MAG: DUF6498-containing protein [Halobacteria archaeon]|nr:DUF6498-containing protein [Halobacteria archaeon]
MRTRQKGFLLAGTLALSLVPLAGVVVLGWSTEKVLFLYWAEAVVSSVTASAKALFAERASEEIDVGSRLPLEELRHKRGGLSLRSLPSLYVRNIPISLSILGISTSLLVLFGLFLGLQVSVSLSEVLTLGVAVSVLSYVFSQAAEFETEYIRRREYEDVSARRIAAVPARRVLLLILVLPFAGGLESESGRLILLTAVVGANLVNDSYSFYVDYIGEPRDSRILRKLLGATQDIQPPEEKLRSQIDDSVLEAEPEVSVTTHTRAVLLSSVANVAVGLMSRLGYLAVAGIVLGGLAFGWLGVGISLSVVALIALTKVGSHYLVHGGVEYQIRRDHLVAYDRLVDEIQWAVETGSVDDECVSAVNRISDRVLGTLTVGVSEVESDGSDGQIGPLRDPDVVDSLGLDVDDLSRPEADRRVLAVSFALSACFLAVPVALFFTDAVTTGEAIAVTVALGPFFVLTVGLLVVNGLLRL